MYKIIQDEKLLLDFIDWLPDLQDGEKYYVTLFARKKYAPQYPNLKTDKCQLKRFTSNKEFLYQKIKQLGVEYGSYQSDGLPVPQESLALYINPNPRSMELAAKNTLKQLVDLVTKPYNGYNPEKIAMNCIQQTPSRKVFFDFDFDNVNIDDVSKIVNDSLNEEAINYLITRGGFHLLVELDKIDVKYKKTWYNNITKISGLDVRGDNLCPVVGCSQGNFVPFLKK